MTKIHSDVEFKAALSRLSSQQQRAVGRLFVENVLALSDNPKVGKALGKGDPTELTDEDIAEGFRTAKTAAIESYTLCGRRGRLAQTGQPFCGRRCCGLPDTQRPGDPVQRSRLVDRDERAYGAGLRKRRAGQRHGRIGNPKAVRDSGGVLADRLNVSGAARSGRGNAGGDVLAECCQSLAERLHEGGIVGPCRCFRDVETTRL